MTIVTKTVPTGQINAAIRSRRKKTNGLRLVDLKGQHAVAVGLSGEVTVQVEGDAGDLFGALNDGPVLVIEGTVGRWAGSTMVDGGLIIHGNAGSGVGAYMSGGVIIVHGDVAAEAAVMNQGGTVIVDGDCGPGAGRGMYRGDLIITGSAEEALGDGLTGGSIYLGGVTKQLSKRLREVPLKRHHRTKLSTYFDHYSLDADVEEFKRFINRG